MADWFLQLIVFCSASIIVYVALCGASLMSVAYRYKIPKQEIDLFLDALKFPLSIIKDFVLGEKSYLQFNHDIKEPYITDKMIWGLIATVIPILFIIDFFRRDLMIRQITSICCAIFFIILLYKSWRFGHSLKLKAQT